MNTEVITVAEVAANLGVGVADVLSEIESGGLTAIRIGSQYRITQSALSAFLNGGTNVAFPVDTGENLQYNEKSGVIGKATVSKVKKDGRWLVQRQEGVKPDGKPKVKSKSFKPHEEVEAREYADKLNRERSVAVATTSNSGVVSEAVGSGGKPRAAMKYVDYLNWFYTADRMACTSRTLDSYITTCRTIKAKLEEFGLGDIKLGDMTEEVAFKVLKSLADNNKSDSTISKARNVIKKTISEAFYHEYIGGKDFTSRMNEEGGRFKNIKSIATSVERVPYTAKEIDDMLEKAKSHATLYPILAVFACTGMRPEELRVLKWSQLDWEKCKIRITNAAVTKRDKQSIDNRGKAYEVIGATKSKAGVRTLPLSERAMEALRKWRMKADEDVMGRDSEYIFFSRGGGFLTSDALSERWKKFVKSNGYSGKNYILYRFRHTVCTHLYKKGFTTKQTAAFLGDKTTRVIEEIYAHLSMEDMVDDFSGIFD